MRLILSFYLLCGLCLSSLAYAADLPPAADVAQLPSIKSLLANMEVKYPRTSEYYLKLWAYHKGFIHDEEMGPYKITKNVALNLDQFFSLVQGLHGQDNLQTPLPAIMFSPSRLAVSPSGIKELTGNLDVYRIVELPHSLAALSSYLHGQSLPDAILAYAPQEHTFLIYRENILLGQARVSIVREKHTGENLLLVNELTGLRLNGRDYAIFRRFLPKILAKVLGTPALRAVYAPYDVSSKADPYLNPLAWDSIINSYNLTGDVLIKAGRIQRRINDQQRELYNHEQAILKNVQEDLIDPNSTILEEGRGKGNLTQVSCSFDFSDQAEREKLIQISLRQVLASMALNAKNFSVESRFAGKNKKGSLITFRSETPSAFRSHYQPEDHSSTYIPFTTWPASRGEDSVWWLELLLQQIDFNNFALHEVDGIIAYLETYDANAKNFQGEGLIRAYLTKLNGLTDFHTPEAHQLIDELATIFGLQLSPAQLQQYSDILQAKYLRYLLAFPLSDQAAIQNIFTQVKNFNNEALKKTLRLQIMQTLIQKDDLVLQRYIVPPSKGKTARDYDPHQDFLSKAAYPAYVHVPTDVKLVRMQAILSLIDPPLRSFKDPAADAAEPPLYFQLLKRMLETTIHDYEYHEALSALAADEKFKGLLYAAPDQGLSTEQMAVQNEAAENLVWDLLGRALKNGIHHTWRARGQGDHNAKTALRHLEEIFTNPAHPLFPPTLSYRDRVQRLLDFLPRKQMPWMPWDILAKVDRDALQAADIDRVMSFEDFYKFAKEINNWKNLPDPAAIAAALETLSFIYGAYPDAAEMNQLITEITPSSMQEKAKQGVRRKGPRTIDDAILKFKQQLQTTSYNTDVDDAITVMNKILRKAILTNDEVLMENVSRQLLRIIGQSYSYRAQPTYFSDKMNDLIRENAIATIQPLALQIGRIFSLFPPRMRGTPEFGQAFTQVLRMRTSVAQRLVIFQEIKKLFPSLLYQDPGSKDKDLFSSVDIPGHPQVTDDILRKILQDVENTSPSILWPNLDTPNSADRAAYLEYFTAAIKLAQDSPAHYRQKILSILGKNVLKDPLPLLAKIDFVYLLGGDPLLRTADGGQKVESVLDFLVDVAHSSPLAFNTYHKLFISPLESMARTGRAPDRLLTFYDRWHLAQLGIGYKDFEKAYPSIGPKLSPRSPSSPQKTSLGGGRPAQAASVTSAPSTLVGQDCAKNFL